MKAAEFEKAISFNLQEVIVFYEPAGVEELELSIDLCIYLLSLINLLSMLHYLTRQRLQSTCHLSALP